MWAYAMPMTIEVMPSLSGVFLAIQPCTPWGVTCMHVHARACHMTVLVILLAMTLIGHMSLKYTAATYCHYHKSCPELCYELISPQMVLLQDLLLPTV